MMMITNAIRLSLIFPRLKFIIPQQMF